MTEKDIVMLQMSRLLLEFSRSGVIVLNVASNAEHSEAGDFIVREFAKYMRKCQVLEIRQNLQHSLRYIAMNAIVPENGIQARNYMARGIKYSSYCVNEVNKGICIFASLCKIGAVKLNLVCIEHKQLLQMLKEEMLLYNTIFPWEDVFMASVRIIDMIAALGYLQLVSTGQNELLRVVGSLNII